MATQKHNYNYITLASIISAVLMPIGLMLFNSLLNSESLALSMTDDSTLGLSIVFSVFYLFYCALVARKILCFWYKNILFRVFVEKEFSKIKLLIKEKKQ